jgi:ribonucleotide monophosphatase NagD (HAD superfamily)
MATNNDLLYMTLECNLPRILIRPFNRMVESTFKEIFGQELKMKIYGKPETDTFRYAERHCENIFGRINKFVMIGDNPEIDF